MSKPRRYWYKVSTAMIKDYPHPPDNAIAVKWNWATEMELEQLKSMPDAEARRKVITAVLIKKTHNIAGAALAAHTSERTAQRWISSYIYAVGRRAGFN